MLVLSNYNDGGIFVTGDRAATKDHVFLKEDVNGGKNNSFNSQGICLMFNSTGILPTEFTVCSSVHVKNFTTAISYYQVYKVCN